jgi:hypothetical protein
MLMKLAPDQQILIAQLQGAKLGYVYERNVRLGQADMVMLDVANLTRLGH